MGGSRLAVWTFSAVSHPEVPDLAVRSGIEDGGKRGAEGFTGRASRCTSAVLLRLPTAASGSGRRKSLWTHNSALWLATML